MSETKSLWNLHVREGIQYPEGSDGGRSCGNGLNKELREDLGPGVELVF